MTVLMFQHLPVSVVAKGVSENSFRLASGLNRLFRLICRRCQDSRNSRRLGWKGANNVYLTQDLLSAIIFTLAHFSVSAHIHTNSLLFTAKCNFIVFLPFPSLIYTLQFKILKPSPELARDEIERKLKSFHSQNEKQLLESLKKEFYNECQNFLLR